jgi:hypothetical protein
MEVTNSLNLRSKRGLIRCQESPDQFSFSTNGHAGESLEPFSSRNLRGGIQPFEKQNQLLGSDLPLLDSFQEMSKKRSRQISSENFGHGSFAIETAGHR